MKKSALLLLPLFIACTIAGLCSAHSKNQKGLTLSPADMKTVCKAAGLTERGGKYYNADKIQAEIDLVDLNGDGQPEVVVSVSDPVRFGLAGTAFSLFIKNKRGQWKKDFDEQIGMFRPLKTKHKGYYDIEIGGPGFCFPVWRWNGQKYVFYKHVGNCR